MRIDIKQELYWYSELKWLPIFLLGITLCFSSNLRAQDADGDGITDAIDIDDDNDGIPDLVECVFVPANPGSQTIVANGDGTPGQVASLSAPFNNFCSMSYQVGDIISLNFTINDDVFDPQTLQVIVQEYDVFTPIGVVEVLYLEDFLDGGSYLYQISSSQVNALGINIEALPSSFPGNDYSFDIVSECGSCLDSDGDGVIDALDLDSDNDGIYDVVEAGHGIAHTAGQITSAVGANGLADVVETTADSGDINYSLADSETSPDGTPDYLELDSDGDGCTDVIEAGFTDDNGDGILGSNPITVNGSGLLTSGIDGYTAPADQDLNSTFDFQEPAAVQSITPFIWDGNSWTATSTITVCEGSEVNFGTQTGLSSGLVLTYPDASTDNTADGDSYFEISSNISPIEAGTYTITYSDGNGCVLTQDYVLIVNELPVANAGPDVSILTGGSVPLSGSATGGDGSYNYNWSPAIGLSATNIAAPTATVSSTSSYTLTVTDGEGCESSDDLAITIDVDSDADGVWDADDLDDDNDGLLDSEEISVECTNGIDDAVATDYAFTGDVGFAMSAVDPLHGQEVVLDSQPNNGDGAGEQAVHAGDVIVYETDINELLALTVTTISQGAHFEVEYESGTPRVNLIGVGAKGSARENADFRLEYYSSSDPAFASSNLGDIAIDIQNGLGTPLSRTYAVEVGDIDNAPSRIEGIGAKMLDLTSYTIENGGSHVASINGFYSEILGAVNDPIQIVRLTFENKTSSSIRIINDAATQAGFTLDFTDNTTFASPQTCQIVGDEDGDGVFNHLDSDSDGDGCSDVLEAGFTDDDLDGILGPSPITVDANGLVTSGSDGYTGTNAFVINSAQQSGCPDNDNDGISDLNDLDDDNDGLLDTEELNCPAGFLEIGGTFNTNTTSGTIPFIWPHTTEYCDFTFELLGSNPGVSPYWGPGVSTQNDGAILPDGEYVNLQPRETDIDAGNIGQYTLDFSSGVADLEFKVGGLDNDDAIEVFAFYNSNPVAPIINNLNLGTDATIIGNRVESTAGSANAPSNSVRILFSTPVDRVVVNSGKIGGSPHYSNSNTIQIFELSYCIAVDTDSDGIADYLDRDSDGDGCSDVLEAGFTDDDLDEILGPSPITVDANGLVTSGSDGYTGTSAFVINSAQQLGCPDNDNDLISDAHDLDDDNDGILDVDECNGAFVLDGEHVVNNFTSTNLNTSDNGMTFNVDTYNGVTLNTSVGPQILSSNVGLPPPFSGAQSIFWLEIDTDKNQVSQGKVTIDFPHMVVNPTLYISGLSSTIHSPDYSLTLYNDNLGLTLNLLDTDGEFLIVQDTIRGSVVPATNASGLVEFTGATDVLVLDLGVYTPSGNDGPVRFAMNIAFQDCIDADNDGVFDPVDLDSDNDGIYDAVESGSGDAQTNGVLNGGVDADGIPLSVSDGASGVDYTYLNTDSDSMNDVIDPDSDGDGCNDVIEAGFPDSDGDGQLGGLVPPTVDSDGTVTSGGL